jgi:hypothetical protein
MDERRPLWGAGLLWTDEDEPDSEPAARKDESDSYLYFDHNRRVSTQSMTLQPAPVH